MRSRVGGVTVQCPYCFEWVEILLDPETSGEMVQDCEVCCRPWQLFVTRAGSGPPTIRIERLS